MSGKLREKIVAGNVYHIVSRGVDKRDIFLDDENRSRFIHDFFEFNDVELANNNWYRFHGKVEINRDDRKPRKFLVEILAFCLMNNHYHLLLKPKFNDSLSLFMKKVNAGYANYFNIKYERKGALFEGRYKLVHVSTERHLLHLFYYIHLNPLDFISSGWRTREIKNYRRLMKFLEKYRWSSFLDYLGKKNFPSVTQREFLEEFLSEDPKKIRKSVENWLKELDTNLNVLNGYTLDN